MIDDPLFFVPHDPGRVQMSRITFTVLAIFALLGALTFFFILAGA